MAKYYPVGDFKIGDRVLLNSSYVKGEHVGTIAGIRDDSFGDAVYSVAVPQLFDVMHVVARVTEIQHEVV